jgi:uncharacterized protein YndB with AHSA1/START domain
MDTNLIVKKSITLHAPIEKVWDALTNPTIIKKYLFGTNTVSDWKVGSPIIFTGTWNDKPYEDKGIILALEREKLLKYSYWSSLAGTSDSPENYVNVTFSLSREGNKVVLTLEQDNCRPSNRAIIRLRIGIWFWRLSKNYWRANKSSEM